MENWLSAAGGLMVGGVLTVTLAAVGLSSDVSSVTGLSWGWTCLAIDLSLLAMGAMGGYAYRMVAG